MGGARAGPPTSWRAVAAAVVALWLVPAVLALAVFWLPLLCCAVAAVRFLRVRRKLVAAASRRPRGCDGGGRGLGPEEITMVDNDAGGGRLRLLHQYLDDQMELVVVEGHSHEEEQEEGRQLSRAASC